MKQYRKNHEHTHEQTKEPTTGNIQINFNGASIINPSGKEIPITEQLLQQTFISLIDAWENACLARRQKSKTPLH